MGYGWEGEKVRLVPLDREKHFANALLWMNDPEVTERTLMGDWPLGRLAEEEFFNERMKSKGADTEVAFALETLDGEHIGFTGIHRIDWRHGVGHTGTLIGRRDLWGRGYGFDAARVRLRYAFDVLGLRILLSEVFADNTASLKMLYKAGYKEAGRIPRRYWKRGAYRDVVLLVAERDAL